MRNPESTNQKYLSIMKDMKKRSSFTSQLLKPYNAASSLLNLLVEIEYVKVIGKNGRQVQYVWNHEEPTIEEANALRGLLYDRIKEYMNKREIKPVKTKDLIEKSKELIEKAEAKPTFVLTDEMCIAHLKASTEYVYKISRSKTIVEEL